MHSRSPNQREAILKRALAMVTCVSEDTCEEEDTYLEEEILKRALAMVIAWHY